jgi:hypothetical protein
LLEQPDRVGVAVAEVAQLRLLLRGGQRHHHCPLGQPTEHRDVRDRRGVVELVGVHQVDGAGRLAHDLAGVGDSVMGEERVPAVVGNGAEPAEDHEDGEGDREAGPADLRPAAAVVA